MMQVIDNKRDKVGDILTQHITRKTDLSVITSLFSIYAFAMLENNLPLINKLRLLFSAPLDLNDKLTLIGDADERKLRNQLTHIVAKDFSWTYVRTHEVDFGPYLCVKKYTNYNLSD